MKTEKGQKIHNKIQQIVPTEVKKTIRGKTMIYAFITFRSMEGVDIFMRSSKRFESKCKRGCVRVCGCCCPKMSYHLRSLYVDDRWPNPKGAILPDNIFWENLSTGPISGCLRRSISTLFGTIILIGAIVCILGIASAAKSYDAENVTPESCPKKDITA